jgi:hypothetical protein
MSFPSQQRQVETVMSQSVAVVFTSELLTAKVPGAGQDDFE